MSKSGKTKYRWYDEYEESNYEDKKKDRNRRKEKRIRSALKGKNFDYLINDEMD